LKPDVRVCPHLVAAAPGPLPWQEIVALGSSCLPHETTDGIVRCTTCERPALVEMVDWGGHARSVRIYRVAGLPAREVEAYRTKGGRGSCDPDRALRELESLVACAGPFTHLVACDLARRRLLACVGLAAGDPVLSGGWRERLPAANDETWFARLQLSKTTGGPDGRI
jgi:hypothetical protein